MTASYFCAAVMSPLFLFLYFSLFLFSLHQTEIIANKKLRLTAPATAEKEEGKGGERNKDFFLSFFKMEKLGRHNATMLTWKRVIIIIFRNVFSGKLWHTR